MQGTAEHVRASGGYAWSGECVVGARVRDNIRISAGESNRRVWIVEPASDHACVKESLSVHAKEHKQQVCSISPARLSSRLRRTTLESQRRFARCVQPIAADELHMFISSGSLC